MKFDVKQIMILKTMADELASGIDPTSLIAFPDDTILNNVVLKDCFGEISKILGNLVYHVEILNNLPNIKITKQKAPFYILEKQVSMIAISSDPITISKFTYVINEAIQHGGMKKLKATQITSWLVQNGYLFIDGSEDTGYYKVATALGLTIGITTENKKNSVGNDYTTNLYNTVAQKFILDNINDISTSSAFAVPPFVSL